MGRLLKETKILIRYLDFSNYVDVWIYYDCFIIFKR